MDGVLVDFERTAFELFGANWKHEIDKPNWGAFSKHPNLYEILKPMDDAMELYNGCVELVGKDYVSCLTALPNRARNYFPDAAQHKIEWAIKYIDPSLRVYFGPFARDKQFHVRHKCDILIDDMPINIDQWNSKGGIGILHTSAKDTLEKLSSNKMGFL